MLTVLRLGENAYGVPIVDELERSGWRMSVATVYVALGGLEERGLVTSATGEPTSERGGRAKRFYRVTAKGIRQIRTFKNTLVQLWRDVPQLQ